MTSHQSEQYLQSLDSNRSVSRELANAIRRGCDAVTQMDLDGIYKSLSEQESLAVKLKLLDAERQAAGDAIGAGQTSDTGSDAPPPGVAEKIRLMEADLSAARKEIQRWNRLQNALLERSARNVNLLANTLVSFFATYPSPYSSPAAVPSAPVPAGGAAEGGR